MKLGLNIVSLFIVFFYEARFEYCEFIYCISMKLGLNIVSLFIVFFYEARFEYCEFIYCIFL